MKSYCQQRSELSESLSALKILKQLTHCARSSVKIADDKSKLLSKKPFILKASSWAELGVLKIKQALAMVTYKEWARV